MATSTSRDGRARGDTGHTVTQVFGSALPMAYGKGSRAEWAPLARLVLEASYEATLLAAAENAKSTGNRTVFLTRLGGGAFGNPDAWIDQGIIYGLRAVEHAGLDVVLVSYRTPVNGKVIQAWEAGR